MEKKVNKKILHWYLHNHRNLPWRKLRKDMLPYPYYIFVSEYMLQQTTVNTVKNKFIEFIKLWPNIKKLSKITESSILGFWSGLGYYARARNLLAAAKIINKKYRNKIPSRYEELIQLPGVGDYTAKAILGIAFNQPELPLDSNIERILSRLHYIKGSSKENKKELKKISSLYISNKHSTSLIQGFMDYGSLICLPRFPRCDQCIIKLYCKSYFTKEQNSIPVKKNIKKKLVKFSRAYVLVNENNEIIVRKRSNKGMLASMLEIPNDEWVENKNNLKSDKMIKKIRNRFHFKGKIKYSFSHFDLYIDVYFVKVCKKNFINSRWLSKNKFSKSSLPTIMKKITKIALN